MKHSLKLILISSTILFASSESLLRPAGPKKGAQLTIGVHIYNDVRVPNAEVGAAEQVASRVLRQAGVELNWSDCTVSRSASGSLSSPCDSPAQSGALVVYFVGPLEAHFHWVDENALACSIIPHANEPATMTYISYPRIRTLSDSTSAGVADLLGLAVAHEIAHLLLGSHEHANQGIMRAYWPWQDLHAEAWGKFQFSRDEANRLRTAVRARLLNRPQEIDYSPIVQMATESKIAPRYCERYRNDVLPASITC